MLNYLRLLAFGLDGFQYLCSIFSSVLALISVTPDLIKKSKKFSSQIPFGPYLILASILFFVSKDKLVNIIFI